MIIGTAGHIDHGKSALVEALTGQRMDPLAEERRRGITIDLHVAALPLEGDATAGVIDVPGHEDLIRTMVAGAAGLDLVLLIVAADEGIMPQTREHLAIVEQLRVPAGIPVLTKCDLVDPEWRSLVEAEVAAWLARSPVRFAPPLATSAIRGIGIAELRAAIAAQASAIGHRAPDDLFRLPVDRALSLAGVGTVLTGTAWSGSVAVGDAVRLLPAGGEGRVRSLEHHGASVTRSGPGARTAVGVAGIERSTVHRGQVLVRRDDPWQDTTAIDVVLELLPQAARPLGHHTRVRLHLGTDEVMARVSTAEVIAPGAARLARLSLERPVLARGGDRFVLRSYSPVTTIGGGWVADPLPPRGRPRWPEALRDTAPGPRLGALVERRTSGVDLGLVPLLLGIAPDQLPAVVEASGLLVAHGTLVPPARVAAAEEQALEALRAFHDAHATERGMPLETLRQGLSRFDAAGTLALDNLATAGRVVIDGGLIRSARFAPRPRENPDLVARLVERLDQAGLAPPSVGELEAEFQLTGVRLALKAAAETGRIIAVEGERFFSRAALDGFRDRVLETGRAGTITLQALRDATGLSRKFLIPLLEWSDRSGLTIRDGDVRRLTPKARGIACA
ncbi:MAG TPA: selenocysteine-specific translation elongation factor [Gemmatimonadales bacterium]|nr:selenocysteine-specific translation elongation factor [Gemmatimonadales bacterium]